MSGAYRPFAVQRIRQGDIDHLHSGIGQQCLVVAIYTLDAIALSGLSTALPIATGEGQRARVGTLLNGWKHGAIGDEARAQDAPIADHDMLLNNQFPRSV